MSSSGSPRPSFLQKIFGNPQLSAEKDRLEAFLAAFPGEYCGFNPDGSLAYSSGFLDLLQLNTIRDFNDIQHALRPGDAAALETCLIRLKEDGQKFILKVQTLKNHRILRFTGSSGHALNGSDQYDIIWAEDVTTIEQELEKNRSTRQNLEHEIRKFHTLLGTMTTPLWMHTADGDIAWCNESYAKILGKSVDEILKNKLELPLTTPKKKTGSSHSIRKLVDIALTTATSQSETKHLIFGGNRHMMQVDLIPLTHLDLVIGQARDITREEEIERRAERNSTANRELMEQLRSAIAIFDGEQRLEFYNSAFAQIWKLEGGWLDTKPKLGEIMERLREIRRLPEQADFRRFKQSWLDMFTATQGPHEDMMYLPDGSVVRSLFMPHPLGGLLMTFEDVTSGLELESSYNTLMAVQKETIDNLAEGVAVYGEHGRLRLWNPSYARLWDLNPEDLDGGLHISQIMDRCRKFYTSDNWELDRERMVAEFFSATSKDGEIRRTDGRIINYSSIPLPDGGRMVTFQDVTDTANIEKALRDKNAALEATERLKLDFIANVSYQLRTPLNAIIGFNEILDKEFFGPLNLRQKEYTKGLSEASERLLYLINDILDLSSLEAGYLTLSYKTFDVSKMLQGIYDLTSEWARGQQIEVLLSCSDNIGTINADESRLKQILLNLIRNAIAYTPAGGRITLSAEKIGKELALSVMDTGPGISQEDQKRIFNPFEKTTTPRDDGEGDFRGGAGLGLTLVKNIIDLHHGRLMLKSSLGEGSVFTAIIPLDIAKRQ
ncbi:MAG: PAS-domain containing protein [Alphaproteobacteria bacterium]|jgi:signal transduction histidine kinase|nr:PAS-domain containing protein [Alphaproteobacteria bacterium]MCB9985866.1 PAS-domain containing protein [Micavibrio sp.]